MWAVRSRGSSNAVFLFLIGAGLRQIEFTLTTNEMARVSRAHKLEMGY
jgi:hypothetical protein